MILVRVRMYVQMFISLQYIFVIHSLFIFKNENEKIMQE